MSAYSVLEVTPENQDWIEQGRDVAFGTEGPEREKYVEQPIVPFIFDFDQATGQPLYSDERGRGVSCEESFSDCLVHPGHQV